MSSKGNVYLVAIFITKLMKSSKNEADIKRRRAKGGIYKRSDSGRRLKVRRSRPALKEATAGKSDEQNVDGISRNECICADLTPKLSGKEPDAHIVAVPEWRLQKVQSPIKLKHEDSNEYDHFEPLEFHGHWDNEGSATFTNNGYTATLRFVDRELPILKGGPLHNDSFIFEQLHFHWSEDDHSGCEHIFEDQEFCMEAHAVHYNTKYESFEQAADKHDGLAVVAFFLKATDDDENPCFKKLSDGVKNIVKIDSTTTVPADCLTWFWDAAHCKGYYTYQGSLTTEPYYESVSWILYPTPIHISRKQVQLFRSMKSTHCETQTIRKNVRPVQEQMPKGKLGLIYVRSHKQGAH